MALTKFYLPYGTLGSATQGREVTFHWFYAHRTEPVAPYEKLILGYLKLTDDVRKRAEAIVDEFFTQEEFHLLRSYLREKHHEDVRTALLVAPVSAVKPDTGTKLGGERPFALRAEEASHPVGLCRLSEEAGYDLPFAVWGYYTTPAHLLPMSPRPKLAADEAAAEDMAEEDADDGDASV